jgi:hypothetical protein
MSAHGTFRTSGDVRLESENRLKADIARAPLTYWRFLMLGIILLADSVSPATRHIVVLSYTRWQCSDLMLPPELYSARIFLHCRPRLLEHPPQAFEGAGLDAVLIRQRLGRNAREQLREKFVGGALVGRGSRSRFRVGHREIAHGLMAIEPGKARPIAAPFRAHIDYSVFS